MVSEKVARAESSGSSGLAKAEFQKSISKLEEVWEGEVGTLKHELWQTIQAHNHNADLLKHHKDAIDSVQSRMTESVPNPELEQVHAMFMQAEKAMQREKEKEMQIDQLLQRLTAVQHQLSVGVAGHWPAGGMVPPTFTMEQAPIAAAASA